jgi:hypothetical protein
LLLKKKRFGRSRPAGGLDSAAAALQTSRGTILRDAFGVDRANPIEFGGSGGDSGGIGLLLRPGCRECQASRIAGDRLLDGDGLVPQKVHVGRSSPHEVGCGVCDWVGTGCGRFRDVLCALGAGAVVPEPFADTFRVVAVCAASDKDTVCRRYYGQPAEVALVWVAHGVHKAVQTVFHWSRHFCISFFFSQGVVRAGVDA